MEPEGINHKPGQIMTHLELLDPKLKLSEDEFRYMRAEEINIVVDSAWRQRGKN